MGGTDHLCEEKDEGLEEGEGKDGPEGEQVKGHVVVLIDELLALEVHTKESNVDADVHEDQEDVAQHNVFPKAHRVVVVDIMYELVELVVANVPALYSILQISIVFLEVLIGQVVHFNINVFFRRHLAKYYSLATTREWSKPFERSRN